MEIANLHNSLDASMIYVTHDQVEAMTLASKILLLNAGESVLKYGSVCQIGTPMDLYSRPRNKFAAGFIGSPKMNFIDCTIDAPGSAQTFVTTSAGDRIAASIDSSQEKPGDKVVLGIRPEHTILGEKEGLASVRGKVAYVEGLGEASYIYLNIENHEQQVIVRQDGRVSVQQGENVPFSIVPNHCHLFDAQEQAFSRTDIAEDKAFIVG